MRRTLSVVVLAGLSALLLAAGCGTAPKSRHPKTGPSGTNPAANADAALPPGVDAQPSAIPGGGPALRAATSAVLGKIIVDGRGMTVYRHEADSAQPSKSTCTGACVTQWPPVQYTADMKIEGIDRKLVGSLSRPDGIVQVTIAGWPIYRYSGDAKAGDFKGQGHEGAWFAVSPDGTRIGGPAPAKSSAGGY